MAQTKATGEESEQQRVQRMHAERMCDLGVDPITARDLSRQGVSSRELAALLSAGCTLDVALRIVAPL